MRACGGSASSSVQAMRMAKLRALRAGDEPLVAVDHPVVAVLDGLRLDERRVGAGDLGLGHREAGAGAALGERAEVALLLVGRRPVEERVHVALVRRLGVDHERADAGAAGLGGDERHRGRAEAHAVPLGGQVRVPEALRLSPSRAARRSCGRTRRGRRRSTRASLRGADLGVHELADFEADFLDIGRESKINGHSGRPPSCIRLSAIVVCESAAMSRKPAREQGTWNKEQGCGCALPDSIYERCCRGFASTSRPSTR